MGSPLLDAFDVQAATRPDAPAVHYPGSAEGDPVDYRTLARRADRLAERLVAQGVRAGDAVGVFFEPDPALVVSVLAIHRLGAAYVMLDRTLPVPRLREMTVDCPLATVLGRSPDEFEIDPAHQDASGDRLYVCYTSGSSGTPKGIVARADSVANLVTATPELRFSATDRVAQLSNPAFDAFTWEVWGSLVNGACLVGADRTLAGNTRQLGAFLADNDVTASFLTTAVFNLHSASGIFAGLRLLAFGGEAANLDAVRAVRRKGPRELIHVYGPTETTTFATLHVVADVSPEQTSLPIGRPLAGCSAVVWHADGRPARPGEPGELLIGGAGVAEGYLNRPELTADKFGPHPAGPGHYRTGDIVTVDDARLVHFLGRLDNQVKIRGHRVELEDVESHLRALPQVREAVVCPVRDRDSVRLVAVVEAETPGTNWHEVYDELYRGIDLAREDDRFRGWHDTAGHQPIPRAEMRHWLDSTVDRIRALRPRRVLEIGVGSGMLLTRIAPEVESYWATDFAEEVVDRLTERCVDMAHVRLLQRDAADLSGLPHGHFDTVVLNSVVQYFPSADYLTMLLAGLLELVAPGGRIFVGDVRDLRLLDRFQAELDGPGPETELLLDPRYFACLPGVASIDPVLKRGRHHNELTRFRYDVVLGTTQVEPHALEVPWEGLAESLATLPDVVVAGGIPNDRFAPGGWSVEDLYELGTAAGRKTVVTCDDHPERMRAWFCAGELVAGTLPVAAGDPSAFANTPASAPVGHGPLATRLVRELAAVLPDYMVPSAVVVRDALPRNKNGKLDRGVLAEVAMAHTRSTAEPPATFRAAVVRAALAGEVGTAENTIAPDDDFFVIGGHSLAAVRLANRLSSRLGRDVTTGDIYLGRTLSGITEHIFADHPAPPEQPAINMSTIDGFESTDRTRTALAVTLARLTGTNAVVVQRAVTSEGPVLTSVVTLDLASTLPDLIHDFTRAETGALFGEVSTQQGLPMMRYGPDHLAWRTDADADVTEDLLFTGLRQMLAHEDVSVSSVVLTPAADHEVMAGHAVTMSPSELVSLLPEGVRLADSGPVPVYVLDEAAQPVARGQVGVLHVPAVSLDFADGPVATVIADSLRPGVMVRTGSAAHWDHEQAMAAGPAGPSLFDDELETFVVLADELGHRSMWPASVTVPEGWSVDVAPTARSDAIRLLTSRRATPGEETA